MQLEDKLEGRLSRSGVHRPHAGFRRLGWLGLAAVIGLVGAGCGTSTTSTTTSMVAHGSNTIPAGLSISSFTVNIASEMSLFKPLTEYATKGADTLQVGVILPDTTSSTRYVDFDQPYLNDAFADAGYTQAQYRIDNAQGSDATELDDATADINLGARVLVMDPLDGPTGVAIAKLAESKGVTMISYDRATFQGTNTYYVSFNNFLVGELIGHGFESCVSSWHISSPKVFVLNGGEDTDPNAISFAEGYNSVVWSQKAKSVAAGATNSLGYSLVGENYAPGWDNTKGGTIFQQEFTAHPEIKPPSRRMTGSPTPSSPTWSGTGSSPTRSRPPGRTPRPRAWPGSSRVTSAVPSTRRSTRRPRTPSPWPPSCWPATSHLRRC